MALSRLLPNLGGPDGRARRLYAVTIHAMALYGAPVWAEKVMATQDIKAVLHQLQHRMANRICRGYRTVSWVAAGVIAGIPPMELLAQMYAEVYWRTSELKRKSVPVTDRDKCHQSPRSTVNNGGLGRQSRRPTTAGPEDRRSHPALSATMGRQGQGRSIIPNDSGAHRTWVLWWVPEKNR